jgi:uncharacterized protein
MVFDGQYSMGIPTVPWRRGNTLGASFVLTEECNLRCRYCYMVNKSHDKRMTFVLGRRCMKFLIDNYSDMDSIEMDFIGGEPTLEIDLLDELMDYWKILLLKTGHKWIEKFRVGMTTNGILYHTPRVQSFIAKNREILDVTVTIDGTQEMHDANRVYSNGQGSYANVVKNIKLWLEQFPDGQTKVTISKSNLPYFKESILHLWSLGIKTVPANPTFEELWNVEDAQLYKKQLIELADIIIEQDLWKENNMTLFSDQFIEAEQTIANRNWCGCGRKMIAFGPDGTIYPCIRMSQYSLSHKPPRYIGHIDTGVDPDLVRSYLALTFQSQSPAHCLECKISQGCAWCQGFNYDMADTHTIFQRSINICEMHKAQHEANLYYWDKLKRVANIIPKKR